MLGLNVLRRNGKLDSTKSRWVTAAHHLSVSPNISRRGAGGAERLDKSTNSGLNFSKEPLQVQENCLGAQQHLGFPFAGQKHHATPGDVHISAVKMNTRKSRAQPSTAVSEDRRASPTAGWRHKHRASQRDHR